MGGFLSGFWRKKDPQTPVKGVLPRIKNVAVKHFRGLLGIIPVIVCYALHDKTRPDNKVMYIWIIMAWWFFLQPVNVPVTGLVPVYMFPWNGVISSDVVCKCYFNIMLALLVLGCMIQLLLNNSGLDKRIALNIMCRGNDANFSPGSLILKCSTAAYFLSIFSNRLIVTSYLTEIMATILTDFETSTARYSKTEPDYEIMRYIVSSAIQISSALGGIVLIHGSFATLTFLTTWTECAPKGMVYEDIFNYLQFSCFTFPLSLVIFICVMGYHVILLNTNIGRKMSAIGMGQMRNKLTKLQNELPKFSAHEKLTLFFLLFALSIFFFRWSKWLNMGWSTFRRHEGFPNVPFVYDATVAAIFVITVHTLPKGLTFLKVFKAKYEKDLPEPKPESAILFWRFVDKNINYGYTYVLGSGLALNTAIVSSGLAKNFADGIGKSAAEMNYTFGLLCICMVATILPNIMTGAGASVVFLPLVLNIAPEGATDWLKKKHLGALAVGLGSSFGYMFPFLYTPAYYCFTVGKVPKRFMAMYGLSPVLISGLLLWVFTEYYAPIIFGSVEYIAAPGKPTAPAAVVEAPAAPELII